MKQKEFVTFQKVCLKRQESNSAVLDKYIFTLSSAAIGLIITFLKDSNLDVTIQCANLIKFSLSCFGFSVVINAITHLLTPRALKIEFASINAKRAHTRNIKKHKKQAKTDLVIRKRARKDDAEKIYRGYLKWIEDQKPPTPEINCCSDWCSILTKVSAILFILGIGSLSWFGYVNL